MRVGEACGLALVGLGITVGLSAWSSGKADEQPSTANPKVRLAVLIVVDQLRGDYPKRWNPLFGDRGFRRLAREGASFENCYYPYSNTFTAAGHASIVTGCSPRIHGIIGNEWYERETSKTINASRMANYSNVPDAGEPENPKEVKTFEGSGTPQRMLAPTVADVLRKATAGRGKIVALSVKDRSAVLPGGQLPHACYWADAVSGNVVTSTYYRGRPHAWVNEYNRSRSVHRWLGQTWERLRDDLDYDLHAGPDDVEGEGMGHKQGVAFPHPFPSKPGEKYYESVANSPFGNQMLVELAKLAIVEEKLGQDDIPDLLTLSFSSNDLIGHTWGPDSHEVLDVTLRTDRDLQSLLQFLDARVGKGQYAVVLSADHGVSPLPERMRRAGRPAGRVDPKPFSKRANDYLRQLYGIKAALIAGHEVHDLYLDRLVLRANRLKQEVVEADLSEWAKQQPEVQTAYTRTELINGIKDGDSIGQKVRRSFFATRNGDVLLVMKPYHFFWNPLKGGTSHGSLHDYDRHVPLMVLGPGVKPGVKGEAVTPLAAAPILSYFLGIDAPSKAEVGVPDTLLTKP